MTYYMTSDNPELKEATRNACDLWNWYIRPAKYVVNRVGTFYDAGNTLAQAWFPWELGLIRFGNVEFNEKYLSRIPPQKLSCILSHEFAHVLGFGWETGTWGNLFNHQTGEFYAEAIQRVPDLAYKTVELDAPIGTKLAHWNEEPEEVKLARGSEFLTGGMDGWEVVEDVSFAVMEFFGHSQLESIPARTNFDTVLAGVKDSVFDKKPMARSLNLSYFEKTELMEKY